MVPLPSVPASASAMKQPEHFQWLRRFFGAPDNSELINLALFALAGLLLILVLDQMVRIGVEISRSRIGMAVAMRTASAAVAAAAVHA